MNDFGIERDKASPGKLRKLKELLLNVDNRICADCGASDPKWASANIGVFICLKCSGAHRSLGAHISKVLSVSLDEWSSNEVDAMLEVGGNSFANSIYEAFLPKDFTKPGPKSTYEERAEFIRSKYERQEFLKPSLRIGSSNCSQKSSDTGKEISTSSSFSSSKNEAGMVEFIGILRVKVIKGTNLAVRDILSSDPYVVLTLGQQKGQTSVMKSNLNPIWNEDLNLSVPQNCGSLKVQVFDRDVISSDDGMGEAEVDIQPMMAAAAAFGDPDLFGDMQIGKLFKSDDNSLDADSTINIISGEFVQKVSLRLKNVESGEIHLQLQWIPLSQ